MAQTGEGRGKQAGKDDPSLTKDGPSSTPTGASSTSDGPSLKSIVLNPPKASVVTGHHVKVTATGIFDDQSQQDMTTELDWTASPDGGATIDNSISPAVVTGVNSSSAKLEVEVSAEDEGVKQTM